MSEYQIVKFRAVDRPLTDKQLEFMECQSSRAEFTKWDFEVEYHYSSFRGNVDEMLRNGYDVFLSYSNYGGREIRMRLPSGLPFPKCIWSKNAAATIIVRQQASWPNYVMRWVVSKVTKSLASTQHILPRIIQLSACSSRHFESNNFWIRRWLRWIM